MQYKRRTPMLLATAAASLIVPKPSGEVLDEQRLKNALSNLNRRIEAGEEFPDACWRVSSAENVPYEKLQAAYDEEQRSRNA